MSNPQPDFQPIPGQFQPPPAPKKSGIPGWAIALIAVLGSLVVLCVVGSFVVYGVLTTLGSRASQALGEVSSQVNSSIASSTVPVATGGASTIGGRVASGDLAFVVRSAAATKPTSDALPPETGKTYYTVTIDVTNTTKTPVIFSALNSQIQDSTGAVYTISLFGQTASGGTTSNLIETIPADGTQSVSLVYEVPVGAGELFWVNTEGGATPAVVKIQ